MRGIVAVPPFGEHVQRWLAVADQAIAHALRGNCAHGRARSLPAGWSCRPVGPGHRLNPGRGWNLAVLKAAHRAGEACWICIRQHRDGNDSARTSRASNVAGSTWNTNPSETQRHHHVPRMAGIRARTRPMNWRRSCMTTCSSRSAERIQQVGFTLKPIGPVDPGLGLDLFLASSCSGWALIRVGLANGRAAVLLVRQDRGALQRRAQDFTIHCTSRSAPIGITPRNPGTAVDQLLVKVTSSRLTRICPLRPVPVPAAVAAFQQALQLLSRPFARTMIWRCCRRRGPPERFAQRQAVTVGSDAAQGLLRSGSRPLR